MVSWGCWTKLHTANLYASLIQIISYTYTSMFNIYNYFEKKNCYKFSMSYVCTYTISCKGRHFTSGEL